MASLTAGVRCAHVSREEDEPITATASRVKRWLLIEQPGPWGRTAPFDSRMSASVAGEVLRNAQAAGARLVLIRQGVASRSGEDVGEPRRWYVARSEPGNPGLASGRFHDEDELVDLDVAALAAEAPAPTESVFLVCTHGKHDPCCSEFGRPVYRAMAEAFPDDAVFESSHTGGDRFAANVVCLPDGVHYGRVEPEEATEIVERHRAGRLLLPRYRGRSARSVPEQAAEIKVRRALDIDAIDGIGTVTASARDGDEWAATVDALDHGVHQVGLRLGQADTERPLTCASDPARPRTVRVSEPRRA